MRTQDRTRRRFMGESLAGLGTGAAFSLGGSRQTEGAVNDPKTIRFGLCADVHKDVIHDPDQRLQRFIEEAIDRKPNFILQLGDFCVPKPENRGFLEIWNQFSGPRYHVLGNHDIDGGYRWEETMAYYGMDHPYYSFDVGEIHFVVLDGNEVNPENAVPGYPRHIGRDQLRWLAADLRSTEKTTLVFSHQSLENQSGVDNQLEVRALLENANEESGKLKVVGCLSGHHHIDYQSVINGINYLQINSMSYYWVGGDYIATRFDAATETTFPYVRYTVPYEEPIFAFVTIDLDNRQISIEGRSTAFIEPGPTALGMKAFRPNNEPSPVISDRLISF